MIERVWKIRTQILRTRIWRGVTRARFVDWPIRTLWQNLAQAARSRGCGAGSCCCSLRPAP
jgi:hypothetical protein